MLKFKPPIITQEFKTFLCFRFEVIKCNNKILFNYLKLDKEFLIFSLKEAIKNFFINIKQQSREVPNKIIDISKAFGDCIIPEEEEEEEDEREEDEREENERKERERAIKLLLTYFK